MGKSVLLYNEEVVNISSSSIRDNTNAAIDPIVMQKKQQQLHKRIFVNEEESFLRNRANAMQTVEQTIVEMSRVFMQLSNMVKEQEEQIQRIDHNVDFTEMNVNDAHTELLRYFRSLTGNRWLMIKIFLVLIFFFIVFAMLMK
jgi:syntaxin 5